jgi:Enterobacterial TraT complement resistance protein
MTHFRTPVTLLAAAVLAFAAGCAAMDKAYVGTVKAVDPDQAKLKQETRWLNPQPNLRVVSPDKMVAFVRVRDSSGSGLDINQEVQQAIEALGYKVTRNIDEAQYILNCDVRYYGENAKVDGGRATMAAGIGGGIVGGVIGHQSGRTGEGAVIGAAATGLLFNTLAQRNKIREFDAVVDVRIGERIEGGVRTTRRAGDEQTMSHSGAATMGGLDTGSSRGGSEEEQRAVTEEDFLYHQNRLVTYVSKLNLAPDEADPALREHLVKALSNVLP